PRLSLWVTPPWTSASGSSSSDSPRSNSLCFFFPLSDPVSLNPDPEVEVEGARVSPVVGAAVEPSGLSVLSVGELQSGSSRSMRPSPSLSTPSAHWGAGVVVDGVEGAVGVVAVVVVPEPGEVPLPPPDSPLPFSPGSRPSVTEARGDAAGALPTAASARKAASARISASLLLMRLVSRFHGRPLSRSVPLPAGSCSGYPRARSWATVFRAPNMDLTIVNFIPRGGDFHVLRMRSLK